MTYNLSTRTLARICAANFRTGSGLFFLGSTFGVFGVLLLRALTMFGADVVVNRGNAYVS